MNFGKLLCIELISEAGGFRMTEPAGERDGFSNNVICRYDVRIAKRAKHFTHPFVLGISLRDEGI